MKVIRTYIILIFCLSSVIFNNSCVTKSNYETLSFFFDGVNNPDSTSRNDSLIIIKKTDTTSNTIVKSNSSIHPPYADRSCDNCHGKQNNFALIDNMPNLCYTCHDDFSKSNSNLHGPVSSGHCNECHNPHNSNYPKLLLKNSQDLCYKCHEKDDVKNNFVHEDIEKENCWNCHDPHGSNTKYFIK